jgi:hypothetical protein
MAYGDLIGDLSQAYMTNAQRAAKNGVQSLAGGPIARASDQLPKVAGLAAGASAAASTAMPADMNPDPQHLGDIFKNPAQLAQPPQPASLGSALTVGVTPTATSPSYPTNSQTMASLSDGLKQSTTVSAPGVQQPINPVTAGANSINYNPVPELPASAPVAPAPQTLDTAYRAVGSGTGNNAIAGRVGANGVTEFSNAPADLANAAGQAPVSQTPVSGNLADAWRTSAPSSGPQFAALGSASNLGDGIGGGLTVGAPGDSQLALTRFQRANDLRDGYKAQDQLKAAQAAQIRDKNFTVVHDGTRPVTVREVKDDQERANTTQGLGDAVASAQGNLNNLRVGQAADAQTQRANRLEDAFTAATAPNATPEEKQRYQTLADPTGAGALAKQLTQAKITETQASGEKSQAEAAKLRSEANSSAGPKLTEGQSKDFNYFERGNAANAELASNGAALTNAATGERGAIRAGIDTTLRSLPGIGNSGVVNSLVSNERQKAEQSGREFINAILRKDSGAALTDPEIAEYGRTYLPQPGDGDDVLKQKAVARTRALQAIKDGLGNVSGIAGQVNSGTAEKAGQSAAPKRYSFAEAQALPSGAEFTDSNGVLRVKH